MFKRVDHIAIVVEDTETALLLWRDTLGFPVLLSEQVHNQTVRLTHLDLGNVHLQLVQPLIDTHPLWQWLHTNGSGLHHICFAVDQIDRAHEDVSAIGLVDAQRSPHQGTQGQQALFLNPEATGGVQIELTGR